MAAGVKVAATAEGAMAAAQVVGVRELVAMEAATAAATAAVETGQRK